MHDLRFIVKYASFKNCFVYLPETIIKKLDGKETGLKILHYNNEYYMSWRSISSVDDSLLINATFARTFNIYEGDEVSISSIQSPSFLSSITVSPWSLEDWTILEYQADKVQSILLHQINLVAANQTIVVWISKGLSVSLLIDSIYPNFKYGRIGDHTEVHVEMKVHERRTLPVPKISTDSWKFNIQRALNYVPLLNVYSTKTKVDESCDIKSWIKKNEITNNEKNILTNPQIFRVYDLSSLKELNLVDSRIEAPYDVFVYETDVPEYSPIVKNVQNYLYRIRKIKEDRRYVNVTSTNFLRTDNSRITESEELIVRLFVIKKLMIDNLANDAQSRKILRSGHAKIFVSANLKRNLKLMVGNRVILKHAGTDQQAVTSISVFPTTSSMTTEHLLKFLFSAMHQDEIVLNSCSRIYFEDGNSCLLLFSPQQSSYLVADKTGLQKNFFQICEEMSDESCTENNCEEIMIRLNKVVITPFQDIINGCQIPFEYGLGLIKNFHNNSENILICGTLGVGKTTTCRILGEIMRGSPYFVHVNFLECKAMKGKKAESVQKIISTAMSACVYNQPSILILDDLDSITSSQSEEENTPDTINASRILDIISNICFACQSSHRVSVVATCTNLNNIGPQNESSKAFYLFRTIFTIPDLKKEDRIDILKLTLRNHIHVPEAMNWDYYGNKTEGWVAQDLIDFAEKASFAAWKRHVKDANSSLSLTEDDISESLKDYKTLVLRGIKLYKNPTHDWTNIGGLAEIKKCIEQLLKWPIQYSQFFRKAPIKNQSGVLLYGMPGTGKTMLAGAIAKECGVNLISVKGPELLSKYIGASEEAVRDVFEKARRSKPCVLFFDEFDSLAPRRGHDSTGVTDRVVNQLLTQLDGVEGREGVAVVAATSRPDLLDPALLRPGRLDKSLLCPLPDINEREEILKVLCKIQEIDTSGLNLTELAENSSGFTGADLNAVLTQAKYDALEKALANIQREETNVMSVTITQQDLVESLSSTSPSLTMLEKEKYRRVYEQFSKGALFENVAVTKQRATLA